MNSTILGAFVGSVISVLNFGTTGFAQAPLTRCIVEDPTGTSLNVRDAPNGSRILETLNNGDNIFMYRIGQDPRGRSWTLVGKSDGGIHGWVFSQYIKCDGESSESPRSTQIAPEALTDNKLPGAVTERETIKMEIESGVYVVPVRFNDTITLNAIVDSGASDVSIPADIVLTLMRTKTITEKDFLGKRTYVLADGSKVPSQVFRIRSLKVGNITVENVVASIASANAEILLGQSFLSKFKSWSHLQN
jgi:predicted aspartyl protease